MSQDALRDYTVQRVDGWPGLWRKGNGTWRISRKAHGERYRVDTGCYILEAAQRIYIEFEVNPGAVMASVGQSVAPDLATRTLKEQIGRYLRLPKERSTGLRIRSVLTSFESYLSGIKVSQIRDEQISAFLDRGISSPNTRRLEYNILRAFFRHAYADGLVRRPMMKGIKPPHWVKADPHKRRLVEKEELEAVLAHMRLKWQRHTIFLCWSLGLDVADVWGLRSSCFDPKASELTVVRRKTKARACVPVVDASVVAAIRWMVAHQDRRHYRDHDRNSINQGVRKACLLAGVEPFTTKALRHSRITLWLRAGCMPIDVARWVGHADVRMTLSYLEESRRAHTLPPAEPLSRDLLKTSQHDFPIGWSKRST